MIDQFRQKSLSSREAFEVNFGETGYLKRSMRGGGWKKRPNQSPEPTAMSVTPPAAQEPRQP
jgi:hypothetical protein